MDMLIKSNVDKKKVIILGGNGFIGKNLSKCCYKHGIDVYSLDIREPDEELEGINYISGDFFDEIFLKEIISDKDIIFHAISTIQPGNSNQKYMSGYNRDMIESIRLFSYLLGTKKKLIFLSSGGTVYGNQKIQPIKEDVMALPINHYGNVKLCIENTMRVFNTQMHSKMLIARISNPYGPGQDFNKGVGFIDAAIKKAMLGDVLEIWGNGDTVRDYIYIDDVCEMLYSLIDYSGEEEVFNISSGIGTSQNDIINIVEDKIRKINIIYKDRRSVDVNKIILDNSKISNVCDIKLISLENGIEKTIDHLKKYQNIWK